MSRSRSSQPESFSLTLFVATIAATLGGLLLVLRFAAPEVWHRQLAAPLPNLLAAFLLVSLLLCFFEYFVHRYVLHLPLFGFLAQPFRQHTLHHALTRIGRRRLADGREICVVENKFPIVEPEQGEASFFPWYTLALYTVIHLPIFAALQYFFPALPWLLGGSLALASSITLYEVLHAINHWSLDRWETLLHHPRWGRFWRNVYGFHLRHHAVIDCNENVCGFFGLPLADCVFGTIILPRTIYADGEEWREENFTAPRPRWPIRQLDALAGRVVQARRTPVPPAAGN